MSMQDTVLHGVSAETEDCWRQKPGMPAAAVAVLETVGHCCQLDRRVAGAAVFWAGVP
jgi:hypothetical protein